MTASKGINKPRAPNGAGQTQKGVKIYIDNDLLPYYNQQPNKARYINTLIRNDYELHKLQYQQQLPEPTEMADPPRKRRPGRPRKDEQ